MSPLSAILKLHMLHDATISSQDSADGKAKSVEEWLVHANGRTHPDNAEQLLRQVLLLREASPTEQRILLLNQLFEHAERMVTGELPLLQEVTLPVSRRIRRSTRLIQELLAALVQEYFNTLPEFFAPRPGPPERTPQYVLRRIMKGIAWHLRISHHTASPSGLGVWQQLHAAYRTSRRLGIADRPGPDSEPSIEQIYLHTLLAGIAQPASFCYSELEFVADYIASCVKPVDILERPPLDHRGVFWVALDKDFPAQALARRSPPSDLLVLYFACDLIARDAREQLAALTKGTHASRLGIPDFADTPAGRGVLRRLNLLWGQPAARRFPRRRQSYRVNLCAGFEQLWQMIRHPGQEGQISEWMVTNESPDGYSLMHISGETANLLIGDIVAIQPTGDRGEPLPNWSVGIIRWALSENSEHIELGMHQLAAQAIAAEIVRPAEIEADRLSALILPETPPLRMLPALVTAAGKLSGSEHRLIVLVADKDSGVRGVRPTALTEQTPRIEVFSVEPDEKL